jgi:hypothetical protein
MTYRLLSVARAELAEAAKYYEAQSRGLGFEFMDEFDTVVERIQKLPEGWKRVGTRHRRCLFRRFPYAVLYAVRASEIIVSGVISLRRDPDRLKRRIRDT